MGRDCLPVAFILLIVVLATLASADECNQEACVTPFGDFEDKVCSGHGECSCNQCMCPIVRGEEYPGKFCEDCPTCPHKCEQLRPIVQCSVFGTGPLDPEACRREEDGLAYLNLVDKLNEDTGYASCMFTDEDGCRVWFAYEYESDGVGVIAQRTRKCRGRPKPKSFAEILRQIWVKIKEEMGRPCPRD